MNIRPSIHYKRVLFCDLAFDEPFCIAGEGGVVVVGATGHSALVLTSTRIDEQRKLGSKYGLPD